MWLFTKIGFFSGTVANFKSPSYASMPRPKDWKEVPYIMVRARVEEDLVRLCEVYARRFEIEPPAIFRMPGHDYPVRVLISHDEWVQLVATMVSEVNYSNFKNAVEDNALSAEKGRARHDLYMKVWSVMNGAESFIDRYVKSAKRRAKNIKQGGFNFWHGRSSQDPGPSVLEEEWLYGSPEADEADDGPEPTSPQFELEHRFNDMLQAPSRDLPKSRKGD